jgi:hypothetical protein
MWLFECSTIRIVYYTEVAPKIRFIVRWIDLADVLNKYLFFSEQSFSVAPVIRTLLDEAV